MGIIISEQLLPILLIVILLIACLSLVLAFVALGRMSKFKKAYVSLQTLMSRASLEDLLRANLKEIKEASHKMVDLDTRLTRTEIKLRSTVDHAQLLRFNSFANMGAELSFALALLDQDGTGILLTSIQSIEECRIYAKAVEKGQSTVKLSPEEKQVIEQAYKNVKKV